MRACASPTWSNIGHHVFGFWDCILHDSFNGLELFIEDLKPRANLHFSVYPYLSLIVTGHEFNTDKGDEGKASSQKQDRKGHDQFSVIEGDVKQLLIVGFHSREESTAD